MKQHRLSGLRSLALRAHVRTRRAVRAGAGLVRAAAVLLVLVGIAVVGTARAAERHVGERFAAFGESLLAIDGFRTHSAPRRLGLNGMELGVVTLSTSLDVPSTLDRLEAVCSRGGLISPETLLGRKPEGATVRAFERFTRGILRQETDERGVVGCIDTGERLDPSTLDERLAALGKTGDLGELGALRFVFVRRARGTTTALVLWSDGSLPFLRAFPKTGDAPGRDLDDVPRPMGSRRLLSASELGAPYAIALYELGPSNGDAFGSYVRELERLGFATKRLSQKDTVLLRKGNRAVLVALTESQGRRALSIARLS